MVINYSPNLAITSNGSPFAGNSYSSPNLAFDGISDVSHCWIGGQNKVPNFIGFNFNTPQRIGKFEIDIKSDQMPAVIYIQGSNDNISYTNLYYNGDWCGTCGLSWGKIGTTQIIFDNPNYYKYYRLYFTSATSDYPYILEIRMYSPKQYLYLLQDKDSILYTYNGTNIVTLENNTLSDINFTTNGFRDPTIIPQSIWDSTFTDLSQVKILMWTDDTTITESKLVYNCDQFDMTQWLKDNQCNLLTWTDDTTKTESKLVYNCDQFDMTQWLKDNECSLLLWTDDTTKANVNMVYNTNPYKPLDLLSDEFDILEYIE